MFTPDARFVYKRRISDALKKLKRPKPVSMKLKRKSNIVFVSRTLVKSKQAKGNVSYSTTFDFHILKKCVDVIMATYIWNKTTLHAI